MFHEKRPEGWVPSSREVHGSRNSPSHTQKTRFVQTRRWYPSKSSRDYDWKARFSAWQSVGKIAVERVLPQVQAAKERDAKIRAELGLPPITNDGGGQS